MSSKTVSRRRDLFEKVIYALIIALLVCMGVHNTPKMAAILTGPAGCSSLSSVHGTVTIDTPDGPIVIEKETGTVTTAPPSATVRP